MKRFRKQEPRVKKAKPAPKSSREFEARKVAAEEIEEQRKLASKLRRRLYR